MTKSAILSGVKTAGRLIDSRPRLMFFESHAHQETIKLLAGSVKKLIARFGITDVLFEMPNTTKPEDTRKILEADDRRTYQHLCENSEIFQQAMKFSNEKYRTKFDHYELTRKNISHCLQGLSFDDLTQIVPKSSPHKMAEVEILNLAHTLQTIGNGCEDRILVSERAAEALGAKHCHHVDIAIADPTSPKALEARNLSIATGIINHPNSIGFFGAAHYRNEEGTGAVDYIEKFHHYKTKSENNPIIHPADLVCIHPFSSPPLDETDAARRTTKPEGNFPIYVTDVTGLSPDDFTLRVGEIVDQHREKFSGRGAVIDRR